MSFEIIRRWVIAILAAASILLVIYLAGTGARFDFAKPGNTFGEIHVDTPEIYTRERLVNDRFEQEAWLRTKLADNRLQGVQARFGSSNESGTAVKGMGIQSDGDDTETGPNENVVVPANIQQTDDTPIEQFRDILSYREEVRNELLENQLDDRHDLAGNTLYRLKFDVTVLPRHDTSAYAMVEAKISGPTGKAVKMEPGWEKEVDAIFKDEYFFDPKAIVDLEGLDDATYDMFEGIYSEWVKRQNEKFESLMFDADDNKDAKIRREEVDKIRFGELQYYLSVYPDPYDRPDDFYSYSLREASTRGEFSNRVDLTSAENKLRKLGLNRAFSTAYCGPCKLQELLFLRTGLADFTSKLLERSIYTYSVTPKERIQRISRETRALQTLGVGFAAEQSGIGARVSHSERSAAQANAIMRQPLVVGYSPASDHAGEAILGWLIGPRFRIPNSAENPVSFRHVPTQYALTGIVSLPAWWREFTLETKTYWLDEHGIRYTEAGKKIEEDDINVTIRPRVVKTAVSLPENAELINDFLDPRGLKPRVTKSKRRHHLVACRTGSVIIEGTQLWRSTVVTLGAQRADAITVLPSMTGIIATFYQVQAPPGKNESRERLNLMIWTSTGEADAGEVLVSGDGNCAAGGASPP